MIDTKNPIYNYSLADVLTAMKEAGIGTGTATQEAVVKPTPFGPVNTGGNVVPTTTTPTTDTTGWDADRLYFFMNDPMQYRNDPSKMAIFAAKYGPNAVAVIKQFGTCPQNAIAQNVSTADQRAYFTNAGMRVSYSLAELSDMTPDQLAAVTNVPLAIVQDAAHKAVMKPEMWNDRFASKFV